MKYAKVIYVDEFEDFLNQMELMIMEDEDVSNDLKTSYLNFINQLDEYVTSKMNRTLVQDIRPMKETDFYYTGESYKNKEQNKEYN